MSTTINLQVTKSGYVQEKSAGTVYRTNSSTWYACYVTEDSYSRALFFGFSAIPDNLKHNVIQGARLRFQARKDGRFDGQNKLSICTEDFDPDTLTYNNQPSISDASGINAFYSDTIQTAGDYWADFNTNYIPSALCVLVENLFRYRTLKVVPYSFYDTAVKTVLSNNSSPYLEVTYDESTKVASKIVYKAGPKSGYSNPRNATVFQWDYERASLTPCADPSFDQNNATFYWKASTSDSYTSVAISGGSKTVTIPANTFPTASTIQWYVSGTDEDGTTTQTSVYSFSTAAGTATAKCVSPVNSVEDGSAPITFRWSLTSTDGQSPSRIRSSWRKESDPDDDQYWNNLFDTSNIVNSFTVPANTFPAGGIRWNIRVWNIDGVEGNRDFGTFICVAAPDAPEGLSATEVAFTTISWQSSEQQAYEISIDGNVVKKGFGADVYSWQTSEPLSDGDHIISVRVQGVYGFWSQPSTITISVQNQAGASITLLADFDMDASLVWETIAEQSDFYVYRDDTQIGHTNNLSFTDRFASGEHSYYVIKKYANGTYSKSNVVTGNVIVDGTFIALQSGGRWMNITRTENSATEQSFKYERRYSLRHVSGAVYPVLELAPYEDFSGSYEFACNDYATAKEFESFRGKEVIIKSRGGVVLFGAMVSLSSHYGDFINGFTFNIQRIHAEDYIDDTGT